MEFEQLAKELFTLQFEHNPSFQFLCRSRGLDSSPPTQLASYPALPGSAWKEFEVTSIPAAERTRVFHSSGTTGYHPSRHFHHSASLALYSQAATSGFARRFPGAASRPTIWALTPDPQDAPHSSLAHMLECLRREFGAEDSEFFGCNTTNGWEVDTKRWVRRARESARSNRPVFVIGTAFSFVHALDDPILKAERVPLPAGSCIVETGGYKGRSRELPREELHTGLASRFGLPLSAIVTEYGMSELSSQAYSGPQGHPGSPFVFRFPAWARALVISPETEREVSEGATGILRIFDLANVWSCFALQTADLAIRRGDAFELIGRLPAAEARGCSLLTVPRS